MNFNIEICPIVNKGKSIHKSKDTLPSLKSSIEGFEIPIQSLTCTFNTSAGYVVPLQPTDCDPYKDGMGSIKWWQIYHLRYPTYDKIPHDSWMFECKIPQGFSEGTCDKCFANINKTILVGNLGFKTDWKGTYGNTVQWQVQRENLPFPGEFITALTVVSGDGDMFKPEGICAPSKCGAPGGTCYYPSWQIQTTGTYYIIAETFFATPTWTAGKIKDYYTDTLGWANLADSSLTYPDCDVYGDESLKYKVQVEGETIELTSLGFSGYGIGTYVSLKKISNKYFEPYDDGVLGTNGNMAIVPWHIMGNGG